eukprot:34263-Eustigmatos_ZCMA.PRE.1
MCVCLRLCIYGVHGASTAGLTAHVVVAEGPVDVDIWDRLRRRSGMTLTCGGKVRGSSVWCDDSL